LKVNEIFTSIDGEGIRQGYLCSFVRLYGCNLKCNYCDTRYACEGGKYTEMTVSQIVSKLNEYHVRNITVTGGEPLLAPEIKQLVAVLAADGYRINIETNGSVDYSGIWTDEERKQLGKRLFLTVDYKLPDSGMVRMMKHNCFERLQSDDVLKFVVQSRNDLLAMKDFLMHNPQICTHVYVSPVFGKISPREIVEFMQEFNLVDIRIQLQIHKFIWDPATRGV
jgi:7-carboxy-7-deazaguanine synthase